MSTLTVYGGTADDYVTSVSVVSYAAARAGSALALGTGALSLIVGQANSGIWLIVQAFCGPFDTSSLGAGATISATAFSLSVQDVATADVSVTMSAVNYDWGASVTTADWRDGTALSSLTIMGSKSFTNTATGYLTFSDSATFRAWINKTGNTVFAVIADNDINNVAPGTGNNEYGTFDDFEQGGSTTGPKLVVTYSAGGGIVGKTVQTSAAVKRAAFI